MMSLFTQCHPVYMEVFIRRIRAILGIKKVKMVWKSTEIPLSCTTTRQKLHAHILLEELPIPWIKSKQDGVNYFYAHRLGSFHIETKYQETEPAYPRY